MFLPLPLDFLLSGGDGSQGYPILLITTSILYRVHFSQTVSMVSQPPSLASDVPVRAVTPVIVTVPPQPLSLEDVGGAPNVPVPTGLDISIEDQHCHCEVISSDSLQNLRDLDTTGKETLWLACKWLGEWILGWCVCDGSPSMAMES